MAEKQSLSTTAQTDQTEAKTTEAPRTKVKIHTEYGDMIAVLYNETPKHKDNFVKLANEKYYDGTLFHRVIKNFMIQGGDPDSKNAAPGQMLGNGGPAYTIPAEFMAEKFFHKKGALAAARLGDNVNPKRESSGSQFYIVQGQVYNDSILNLMEKYYGKKLSPEMRVAYSTVGGTPHLDGQYTVFGEVIEGLDVIDKIAAMKTGPNDRPATDVKMTVTVIQ